SKVGVYPPDWPTNPSRRPNWVWAGDNALGDLSIDRLGNIHETWEVYLSGERYVLDKSGTSAGTFTLTVEGDETDPIDWDAGAAAIKSALEELDSVDEVTVIHNQEDREFYIISDAPTDLPSDMPLDDAELTGTAT